MDFSRQRTGESLLEGGIPPRTLYVHPTGDPFNGGLIRTPTAMGKLTESMPLELHAASFPKELHARGVDG